MRRKTVAAPLQQFAFIVHGEVVVDVKVVDRISDHDRGQMLDYVTHRPAGVILNFKRAKLEWERLVLTNR
jgi:GxxExxY protein